MRKHADVVRTPRRTACRVVAADDLDGVLRLKNVSGTPVPRERNDRDEALTHVHSLVDIAFGFDFYCGHGWRWTGLIDTLIQWCLFVFLGTDST